MKNTDEAQRANSREVKLDEILQQLIKRAGYNKNRKEVAVKLDISESRLSQYLRNQERPSFHNLLKIADFFGVSLDYLVYGQEGARVPTVSYEPLQVQTELMLDEMKRSGESSNWTKQRIAQLIMERIDGTADQLLGNSGSGRNPTLQPDLLLYKDIVSIEQCSTDVLIITTTLQNDVVLKPDGTMVAGRFLKPVAQNLKRGCQYRYIMPILPPERDRQYWERLVDGYRRLLHDNFGVDGVSSLGCQFKVTDAPVITGCALYHLDVDALKQLDSILHEQLAHAIDGGDWLGCSISPSARLLADTLMDTYHLGYARLHFGSIWADAGDPF